MLNLLIDEELLIRPANSNKGYSLSKECISHQLYIVDRSL